MKDFIQCFVYPVSLAIFGIVITATGVERSLKQVTDGLTIEKLSKMKKDCEKDLTRSENCVIVVSYKPETSKETEKDGK